ncbi:hypothetical protein LTR37_004481 [Vermiconidia calcicola]|uniref:Uncharacterized protein n=1 Tax=Vermiconidia calcicola TaxID=1690605 RepID=A0ACC3NMW2_9PEZI|nr:hypothetical protein LTR37_004481 [Vermiconidia calcicola]
MAIDHIPYPEATDLAHAEKGFYPVRIPVAHWQLRHYISTPEPDLLYFASGHDIYCLNTATKKRKHVATLPFEARCTASGFGYVCVGGEDCGHFAAIKLDGSGPRTLDVDSALPIEPWRQQQSTANGRRAASFKVERIGEDIVNSVSIHRIQDEDAHLDDIVAILTNNDKTVRIYSLPSGQETTVLDLPFMMNHASISPDGQTLIAVGDVNLAYFFQREIQQTPPQIPKPHNRLTSASIEWTLTSVVSLHVSEPASTMCYFTTAWSPSGQLVAVGSEGGYISVFDIDLLINPDVEDDDAVVAVVPGSRPDFTNPYPGAIRSLMFSPDPWDLLIWAEDQGRICIGDLRTGLKSRQTINLEPKDETLRRITYEDVPGDEVMSMGVPPPRDIDELEADFIRRYRQAPTDINFATEYIEARRRQRQQRADMASLRSQMGSNNRDLRERIPTPPPILDDDPRGLTAREQQVLESLRMTRQREEARASAGGVPRTVNYTSGDMFRDIPTAGGSNRSTAATTPNTGDGSSTRPISEILSSVQDSLPELSRTNAPSPGPRPSSSHGPGAQLPPLSILQDSSGRGSSGASQWATTTNSLVRLSDGSRLPRRRASVVLTPPATNSPSTASNYRQPTATADEAEENPWRTIEEHMSLTRGPLFESPARLHQQQQQQAARDRPAESELQAELTTERQRARSLARQRERLRNLQGTVSQGNQILIRRAQGREVGVRTAGLAMSADGRTLWAACEEGIFEVRVGLKGRMFWPAVEPR